MVIGALIIISPTVGSTLTYYYCSDLYMLGYFLAVLSVWFMVGKGGRTGIIFSGIALMLSAALYQAYISFAILLCLMYIMKLLIDNKVAKEQIYKSVGTCILGGILGIALYLSSNKIVQIITGIKATEDRGFSRMGMIDTNQIINQIKNCYITFFEYYFSDSMINNNYYGRKYINLLFFIAIVTIIIIILRKQKLLIYRKIFFVLLLLFIPLGFMSICILAPEVSVLDNTGVLMLPTMNYIYVFAVILFESIGEKNSWFTTVGIALFVQLILVFLIFLSLELGGQVYIKHNMLKTYNVAMQIHNRIEQYRVRNKICVIGNMEEGNYPELYPDLKNSQHWVAAGNKTIWPTFEGTQNCWICFIKQYLGKAYTVCSLEEYYEIINTPKYSQMGIFPDKNGVSVINDIVVIKLSDTTW